MANIWKHTIHQILTIGGKKRLTKEKPQLKLRIRLQQWESLLKKTEVDYDPPEVDKIEESAKKRAPVSIDLSVKSEPYDSNYASQTMTEPPDTVSNNRIGWKCSCYVFTVRFQILVTSLKDFLVECPPMHNLRTWFSAQWQILPVFFRKSNIKCVGCA